LFQLTNDELPTLAAGQMSLLSPSRGVQAWQVESLVYLAIDLKTGTWSRTRLAEPSASGKPRNLAPVKASKGTKK